MLGWLASHGDKIDGILILATWLFGGQNCGEGAHHHAARRWRLHIHLYMLTNRALKS
jgi:hypothetical protein